MKRSWWLFVPPAHPHPAQLAMMWLLTSMIVAVASISGATTMLEQQALIDPQTQPAVATLAHDARSLEVPLSPHGARDSRNCVDNVEVLTPETSCAFAHEVAAVANDQVGPFQVYDQSVARVREVTCSGREAKLCTTPTGQAVRIL